MATGLMAATRTSVSRQGWFCLTAGVLGAASGVFLAVVPADVSTERFSYPLDATAYAAIQAWFAVQHLGLLAGLLGLWATGVAGTGRAARIGHRLAVAGMVMLTAMELFAISAARADLDSTRVGLLNAGYGVASLLIGVGLVLTGIAVLRAGHWQRAERWLPLVMGVWVFVPMTPALAGPFVAARLAITGWMVLFALLGLVLIRGNRTAG